MKADAELDLNELESLFDGLENLDPDELVSLLGRMNTDPVGVNQRLRKLRQTHFFYVASPPAQAVLRLTKLRAVSTADFTHKTMRAIVYLKRLTHAQVPFQRAS